jgi:UTP--glucose-1-phosphate uridylyltransferase
MKIRKAIFPAAGFGTRFLPATKVQPKEMLPILDKPAIQYVVEEAKKAGINELLIVTAKGKEIIENHFDRSFELEHFLEKKKKIALLKAVKEISELANIYYIRQKEPLGLGDAILCGRKFVDEEPFAVFLADDIIDSEKPAITQLIEVFETFNSPTFLVEEVPKDKISSYGIIKAKNVGENIFEVYDVIEKPSPSNAPSNLGIIGRYIFYPKIFEVIEKLKPGKAKEIQLTDAIRVLIRNGVKFYAKKLIGKRYDIGTHFGYIQAIIEFALKNKDISSKLREYLSTL